MMYSKMFGVFYKNRLSSLQKRLTGFVVSFKLSLLCCISVPIYGQTIAVNPGRYRIDDTQKLIVCNQVPALPAGSATSVQLDHLYTFENPITSINTTQFYPVTYNGSTYQLSFTQFPIITIDTKGLSIVQNVSRTSIVSLTDANGAVSSNYAGVDIHGASSAYYPKKSYDIAFWADTVNRVAKDVTLLDMRSDSDWFLMAMFSESLRINNVTSHALWRTMHQLYYLNQEPSARSGIRTRYVDVFINGTYAGIYALAEKMDRKQLQLKKTKDTGAVRGELYKAVNWTGATLFAGMPAKDGNDSTWAGFELKYPKQAGFWTNLYALVESTVNWSDADFTSQIASKWQIDNLVDYFLFLNLVRATDNTGKNVYVARYKEGEPYIILAWDLDGTWGFLYEGSRDNVTNDILSNGFFNRLLSLNPGNFRQKLKTRWFSLRAGLFSSSNLKNALSSNADLLVNNGAYLRERMQWGVGSVSTELAYMNTWIDNRTTFLDNYFSQFPDAVINLSGTIYNDRNGLTDGIVNGTPISSLSGNTFSVNLVGTDGNVLATTSLTNGTYSFTNVTPNTSYSIVLTNFPGTIGAKLPGTVLIGGVVDTGETIGSTLTGCNCDGVPDGKISILVTTNSVINIDFGLDRLPTADLKTASATANPGRNSTVNVPTLTGSDPEDGIYSGTTLTNTVIVQSLPVNGKLYYDGKAVTAGQVIPNYAPSLLTIDPDDGPVSITFTYSQRDAAAKDSPAALVTLPFIMAPDLSIILYARPLTVYGNSNITVVVDILELNSVDSNGPITVKMTRDTRYSLSLPNEATSIDSRSVQNRVWSFDDRSNPSYYILTTTQPVEAGGKLSFGLQGVLAPLGTTGGLSVSSVITEGSGGEANGTNNIDADKIDYFQQ